MDVLMELGGWMIVITFSFYVSAIPFVCLTIVCCGVLEVVAVLYPPIRLTAIGKMFSMSKG